MHERMRAVHRVIEISCQQHRVHQRFIRLTNWGYRSATGVLIKPSAQAIDIFSLQSGVITDGKFVLPVAGMAAPTADDA